MPASRKPRAVGVFLLGHFGVVAGRLDARFLSGLAEIGSGFDGLGGEGDAFALDAVTRQPAISPPRAMRWRRLLSDSSATMATELWPDRAMPRTVGTGRSAGASGFGGFGKGERRGRRRAAAGGEGGAVVQSLEQGRVLSRGGTGGLDRLGQGGGRHLGGARGRVASSVRWPAWRHRRPASSGTGGVREKSASLVILNGQKSRNRSACRPASSRARHSLHRDRTPRCSSCGRPGRGPGAGRCREASPAPVRRHRP